MLPETCLICSEPITILSDSQKLGCQCIARYHKKCIFGWLEHSATCPTCRSPVIVVTRTRKHNEGATFIGMIGMLLLIAATIALAIINRS